ncbi:unnamed protein product [Durusdinium trenchii]|uniref:Uncharacterized protein n=1 Tax=Durusdinium trenchii TaxID=1381693 RepID=A0ABP0HBE7_9DINO
MAFIARGKTYGTLLLGEDMMKGIAFLELKDSTSMFTFLRAAMCACTKQHGSKVLTLVGTTDTTFKFSHQPIFGPVENIEVEFDNLKEWKKSKASLAEKCEPTAAFVHFVDQSGIATLELQRAHVQKTLLQLCLDNPVLTDDILFTKNPCAVYTQKAIKKKALKLYPAGTVSMVKDEKPEKYYIQAYDKLWLIVPFKPLTDFKGGGGGVLYPFWSVKSADDGLLTLSEVSVVGCKTPFMVNAGPLSNVTLLSLSAPHQDGGKEPPAKRQKAK